MDLWRATVGAVGFVGLCLVACSGSSTEESAGETSTSSTSGDTVLAIELEFDPAAHVLGGTLHVHTNIPARLISATMVEPSATRTVPDSGLLAAGPSTELAAMILGLKAERAYTFEVVVEAPDGSQQAGEYVHQTPSLPQPFVPLEFVHSDPERMQPGVTFFDSTAREGFDSRGGYLVAVDEVGDVVWYYTGPEVQQPCDLRRLSNGNLIFLGVGPNRIDTMAVEINMLGRVLSIWPSPKLGIGAAHADLAEIPTPGGDGPILTAGLELREIAGYPGDKTYSVVGDTIIEFSRAGDVTYELSLLDVLDPYRIVSPDFHSGFWGGIYGIGTKDWAHVNAVSWDPSDDAYLVSARHQDVVFKVARDGTLLWVLGADDPMTPGDDSWPYLTLLQGTLPSHMHAAKMLPDDHVLMFDNASASGHSRAVEYAIDPDALTASEVWSYQDPAFDPPVFSAIVGDADRLPGGNVLIDFGAIDPDPETIDLNGAWAHIVEVDPESGEKVFELNVRGQAQDTLQRLVYRADRQPSLYP